MNQVFGDGENGRMAKGGEDFGRLVRIRSVQENDVALIEGGEVVDLPDGHGMTANLFAGDQLLEIVVKGIAAIDTDHKRGGGIGESPGGPFDEFSKIKQEGRLDLVFGGRISLRPGRLMAGEQQQQEAQNQPDDARQVWPVRPTTGRTWAAVGKGMHGRYD